MSQSINYSSKKLIDEFSGRSHIRELLVGIKLQYGLVGKKIVELGCGLGDNLRVFLPENDVMGFEGLVDATNLANQNGLNVVQADLDNDPLPLGDGSVDVVLCMDILEHLMRPEGCVLESYRVLRDNGFLIINVPNHFTFSGRFRILFGSGADSQSYFPNNEDWENPHIRFFRHASAVKLLEKCGFVIVEDISSSSPVVPGSGRLTSLRKTQLSKYLAKTFPDLFAGGFFIIAAKIENE